MELLCVVTPPALTPSPCSTRHANFETIKSLNTVDPAKVAEFELDPCGGQALETWEGIRIGRGNCTR